MHKKNFSYVLRSFSLKEDATKFHSEACRLRRLEGQNILIIKIKRKRYGYNGQTIYQVDKKQS